jgi:sarcosine oxidase delta subunit
LKQVYLHNVIIAYVGPFSHTHRAVPYTAFPTQTCILFVLTRPNTNLTQYEVWDSLGGQCKRYSLLACDNVQVSILSPEYWSVQHSEDCGNMYLSNVGAQNMIKNATLYPKVSYEGV